MTRLLRWVFLAGMSVCGFAFGEPEKPLTMCVSVIDIAPYLYLDHDGILQQWAREALHRQGWEVKFVSMPLQRCRAGIARGDIDGTLFYAYTDTNAQVAVFPMANGRIDEQRYAIRARGYAYRRVGSAAEWDGNTFSNLKAPVGFVLGTSVVEEKLKRLHIDYNHDAYSLQQSFDMLLAGRIDITLSREEEANVFLMQPAYAGKFERLPTPFLESLFYIAVSHQFYARASERVERFWDDVAAQRAHWKSKNP